MPTLIAETNYFQYIFGQGGIVTWILLLLSVAVLAWSLMLAVACRRATLCPAALYNRLVDPLGDGDPAAARRVLDDDPSVLAALVSAGLSAERRNLPPDLVQQSIESAGAEQYSRWNWRLGYLAVAAAVAPMLGLLGTVIGMIEAFQTLDLARQVTQDGPLAGAIAKALITTWMGLVIAIPTLIAHAVLRHRLGLVMLESAARARALLDLFHEATTPAPARNGVSAQ